MGPPPLRIGIIGAPLRGLPDSGYPPPKYMYNNFLLTPLYVYYDLIWAFSVFGIICICQNMGAPPPWKIGKFWIPPSDEWQHLGPPSKASPSSVFWMVPKSSDNGRP